MQRATPAEAVKLILVSLVGLIAYGQIKLLVAMFIVQVPPPESYPEMIGDMIIAMIFFIPIPAMAEELLGRMLPSLIALLIFSRHRSAILPLMILSPLVFALLHALGPMSAIMALWTYLPLGIVLQVIYLKCGGWKGSGGILTGLLSCWAVHIVYNWASFASMVLYAQ